MSFTFSQFKRFKLLLPGLKRRFFQLSKFKKYLPLAILAIFVALIVVLFISLIIRLVSNQSTPVDNRVNISGPKGTASIKQNFQYTLKDSKGKKITDIDFWLDKAELRDEIIVKGVRTISIQGKTFLILTVKLTNSYSKALSINTRDYFRLIINNNPKDLISPESHSDPVIVEPESTKTTRVGWSINDTDKNLSIQVGEISGKKSLLKLDFK